VIIPFINADPYNTGTLLLVAGGNSAPSAQDVTNLLGKLEIDVDEARLTQLLGELEGKDVEELVALGKDKLLVGGFGGGGAPAAAAPAASSDNAAPAAKAEKPKVEEVDALDGGMDMFGGSGGGGSY
jgi:large subunit ribosomal protein LP2